MSAGHIVTASVLGAPAGLLIAKIMFPETQQSETGERHTSRRAHRDESIDALCTGASEGVMLSINVMAMLIAFVAVVALLNGLFVWPQHGARRRGADHAPAILGWMNAPFAWLMGVPWKDCGVIGQVLGERIVLNEFVGYIDLSDYVKANPGALDRAPSRWRATRCAASPISPASRSRSAASARSRRSAATISRASACARWSPGLLACYLFAAIVGIWV